MVRIKIVEKNKSERKHPNSSLKSATGIWAHRKDWPNVKALRKEFDREFTH